MEEFFAAGSEANIWRKKMAEKLQEMALEIAAGQPVPAPRAPFTQALPSQPEASQTHTFHLNFVSDLPKLFFTFDLIRAVGDGPLQVELLDSNFKRVTGRDTKMVEISVIRGDFEPVYESDCPRAKIYEKDIVCPREDKGSLLCGKRIIRMEHGVAVIDDLKFTDNSSWTRNKSFKLGARVRGIRSNEIVREAVSNAFRVKDRRGKASKKHDSPNLNDEVWRLKWIRKDGPNHQHLCQNGIGKMIDFLRGYNVDPSSLRNLLKVSEKQWVEIIKQATKCTLTNEMYRSLHLDYDTQLEYNCVWEIKRVIFADGNSQEFETLDDYQKGHVRDLRLLAYKNKWISPRYSQAAYVGSTSLPNEIGNLSMVASPNHFNANVGATGLDSFDISDLIMEQLGAQPLDDSNPYNTAPR